MNNKTKLVFLGSGSAFYLDPKDRDPETGILSPSNYQSNMLIERNGKHLLIDCGSDIRFSLAAAGYRLDQIDSIYVSHPHGDHVGGLEYVGFATYFNPNIERPRLFVSRTFATELWSESLAGGLRSLQCDVADMATYFDVVRIRENGKFIWEDIEFRLVQTIHIMNGYTIVPSFGLIFTVPETGSRVFITTDTQHAPNQIADFYRMADVIFHDCETSFRSGVHAHFDDLRTLQEPFKNKMWLYHYQPNYKSLDAVGSGFRGWVERGQVFEL